MVLAYIAGFVTGGFLGWCVMDCLDDVRWWKDHGR